MFENLNQDKEQNLTGKNPSPASPVPAPTRAPQNTVKAEDMFAGLKDLETAKRPSSGALPVKPSAASSKADKKSGDLLPKLLIAIIILVVVLAGLFLAGRFLGSQSSSSIVERFYSLKSLIIKEKPAAIIVEDNEKLAIPEPIVPVENQAGANLPIENIPAENPVVPVVSELPAAIEQPAATTTFPLATTTAPAIATTTPVADTDADGLSDKEELSLGTNPLQPDTDNDDLTDYQEMKTYLTDPLNSDTDGDTYLDGAEVLSGYNPKGTGKLLIE